MTPANKKDPPIAETLKAVINTLEQVTVSGKMNMDRLLGSIIALERCVAQAQENEEAQKG